MNSDGRIHFYINLNFWALPVSWEFNRHGGYFSFLCFTIQYGDPF